MALTSGHPPNAWQPRSHARHAFENRPPPFGAISRHVSLHPARIVAVHGDNCRARGGLTSTAHRMPDGAAESSRAERQLFTCINGQAAARVGDGRRVCSHLHDVSIPLLDDGDRVRFGESGCASHQVGAASSRTAASPTRRSHTRGRRPRVEPTPRAERQLCVGVIGRVNEQHERLDLSTARRR